MEIKVKFFVMLTNGKDENGDEAMRMENTYLYDNGNEWKRMRMETFGNGNTLGIPFAPKKIPPLPSA